MVLERTPHELSPGMQSLYI